MCVGRSRERERERERLHGCFKKRSKQRGNKCAAVVTSTWHEEFDQQITAKLGKRSQTDVVESEKKENTSSPLKEVTKRVFRVWCVCGVVCVSTSVGYLIRRKKRPRSKTMNYCAVEYNT